MRLGSDKGQVMRLGSEKGQVMRLGSAATERSGDEVGVCSQKKVR